MKKLLLFLGMLSFTSCFNTDNLEKQINQSTSDITDAITRISANGDNMTEVLNELEKKLPGEVKSIISVDIDRLVKTTVATTGAEFRCDADFLRKRIILGLENLKIKLYNQIHKDQKPYATFPPTICNPVPPYLDLNSADKPMQLFGYDFNDNLKVYAVNQQGIQKDISTTLNRPSDYLVTLTTDKGMATELASYKELNFYYNNAKLYNMAIIPVQPKVCDEMLDSFEPTKIDFIAQKCNNEDAEFDGHGPIINSHNKLYLSSDKRSVLCEINFMAVEKGGGSCASYHLVQPIYEAKPGYAIKEILSPVTNSVDNFEDTDHQDDNDVGANGFIANATYRGDHEGDDIGTYTGATLHFGELRVTLIECCDNCVEKSVIQKLSAEVNAKPGFRKYISSETMRLMNEVKKQ